LSLGPETGFLKKEYGFLLKWHCHVLSHPSVINPVFTSI
jgi:hypothetical protein